MAQKKNTGTGIGVGTVVFIVLIVVALVNHAPLWGVSWGWFIFQSVLIWLGISLFIPIVILLLGLLIFVAADKWESR
jgi:hypothetical protein